MELTKFPKVRYTMMENHLFAKLPKNGRKVDSADVAEMRKKMGDWDVKFPLKNITVTMQNLINKIDKNKEPFRIIKEDKVPGQPTKGVVYWVEKRGSRK